MLEGLRTEEERVQQVIMLLAYGCPVQAIVHAFGLDERTVADWQKRAGRHCQRVHEGIVQQGKVKSQLSSGLAGKMGSKNVGIPIRHNILWL